MEEEKEEDGKVKVQPMWVEKNFSCATILHENAKPAMG